MEETVSEERNERVVSVAQTMHLRPSVNSKTTCALSVTPLLDNVNNALLPLV